LKSTVNKTKRQKNESGLKSDDRTLISGAISFSNKTVADVQTKIDAIFMLHIDTRLTFDEIARIYLKGRSRVPVYEGDPATDPQFRKFAGVLLLKNLIILDTAATHTVREILDIYPVTLHCLYSDITLDVALNQFQATKSHIALVQTVDNTDPDRDPFPVTTGLVTMEDLIEELIGEEIEDETDASLSPSVTRASEGGGVAAGKGSGGSRAAVRIHPSELDIDARGQRRRRNSSAETKQVQFLNYITERRQAPTSSIGAETVLVVSAALRSKHADVFGPLKFSDGALEAYIQSCRVTVFDAANSSSTVSFPHALSEFDQSVSAPFIVLQGVLSGEMGREKFPAELHTFHTFGLSALTQKLYVSDSRIVTTGAPPVKVLFFDVAGYRRHMHAH